MKLSSAALSMLTISPSVFGEMITRKPNSTHLFYKIKTKFDSLQHGFRNLEEDVCCDETGADDAGDDAGAGSNSPTNSPTTTLTPTTPPSTLTPTTPMPSNGPTTRSEAISSAMFNIYTALGTTTVDLTGTTYCTWTGVTCDSDDIEPTAIRLSSKSLNGYLATDIGVLTDLASLDLGSNALTGSIPDLSGLPSLTALFVRENQLTGGFPALPPSLIVLFLNQNALTGSIPDLSGLPSLSYFFLQENQLTGGFPALPPSLKVLFAYENQITGSVPDLSGLSNLIYLVVDGNQLTGISALPTQLEVLSVGFNQITSLPDFSGFDELAYIDAKNNQLTGTIDTSSLPSNSELYQLYLNDNFLTGSIPSFSEFQDLQGLNLSTNDLTSTIPSASSWSTDVDYLYVAENELTGPLPNLATVGLFVFDIRANLFDGLLPDWMFDDVYDAIDVSGNQFTGTIPTTIGDSNTCKYIFLNDNQFTGTLPTEIGQMTLTFHFNVADNSLTGAIPASVGNMDMDDTDFFFSVVNNSGMTGVAPSALCSEEYFHYDGTGVSCA